MISVLVVTYNGETYIREQIDSILKNIGLGDELVVSDDGSLILRGKSLSPIRNRMPESVLWKDQVKALLPMWKQDLGRAGAIIFFLQTRMMSGCRIK